MPNGQPEMEIYLVKRWVADNKKNEQTNSLVTKICGILNIGQSVR